MNRIPHLEPAYDFCWSICSMEQLGSIERGLAFVEKSLSVLKPGGVAIHTTEFNYLSEDETIDNGSTVLFRKKDILQLAIGEGGLEPEQWGNGNQVAHLKLAVDGFPSTCYGLVVVKGHCGGER